MTGLVYSKNLPTFPTVAGFTNMQVPTKDKIRGPVTAPLSTLASVCLKSGRASPVVGKTTWMNVGDTMP